VTRNAHITVDMNSKTPESRNARRSVTTVLVAMLVAVLGFLPIINLIPGGHQAPWYAAAVSGWISGSAIVIGVGVVLAILSRRFKPLWRDRALDRLVDRWRERPHRAALVVAIVGLALFLAIAHGVFDQRPLFIDELTQALQARIFADGMLWRASGPHPEFFSSLLMADVAGRHFSQFPAGGPAMLVPGVLLGAPWIVDPVYAAIGIVAFAAFLRVAEPRAGIAMSATVLLAFAPFTLFMSGSQMNHVPTLMWILLAMASLARVMTSGLPRPVFAFVSGLAFGCAATIRPVDALAFALPAGAWYLARALRDTRRWRDALAAAAGVAIPITLLLWVNHETTGKALLFGYQLVWGKSHNLGFHAAPWGMVHTPARGLELINSYLLQLQTYLYESPLPSLLPVIGALALTRKLAPFDRYLLASDGLLLAAYFGYWHDGAYLGPRFVYLLLPTLALYTARFFPLVRDRFGSGLAYRTIVYAAMCSVLIAATILVPLRARQYASSQTSMRRDVGAAAATAGVSHALVFVRESWGSQLIARLWALGVSRGETEMLYRNIDACMLEHRIDSLERVNVRGAVARDQLQLLLPDSSRLVKSPFSPDSSERYLRGYPYATECIGRINSDRGGFTLLLPTLLARRGDNVFARDLGARDSLLIREYPTRSLYLLRPQSAEVGAELRFYALTRDSLSRAWGSEGDDQ
jgi:hypothetical protein